MFRSMTIIRELVLYLAKVILKHSVKLRRYILCGDVAACHRLACVLCAQQSVSNYTQDNLSCLVCNCCWLTVCIVVVVLCVLLSYVYLLYYVGIAVFYFRCRTAG